MINYSSFHLNHLHNRPKTWVFYILVFLITACTATTPITEEPTLTPRGTPTPLLAEADAQQCSFEPMSEIASITEEDRQTLSTPELIEKAYGMGDISEEQRLVYLTYALGEISSLPSQLQGNAPWRGTSIAIELSEITSVPENMCALDVCTQAELKRLLGTGVSCQ